MNKAEKQSLIDLAKKLINHAEQSRDEIPFGLGDDIEGELTLIKIALAALTAEPDCYSVGDWNFTGNDAKKRAEGYCKTSAPQKQPIAHYTVPSLPAVPGGWIKCSDRMPDDSQYCVVNTEYGYFVQCWAGNNGWLGDDISIPNCDVTHWMPLPAAPEVQ